MAKKELPILQTNGTTATKKLKLKYDCTKCPGYCCSYPHIEVTRADISRLAKHFALDYKTAESRFTKYDKDEKARGLRHRGDVLAVRRPHARLAWYEGAANLMPPAPYRARRRPARYRRRR